jgi:hypothetical protein
MVETMFSTILLSMKEPETTNNNSSRASSPRQVHIHTVSPSVLGTGTIILAVETESKQVPINVERDAWTSQNSALKGE